MNDESKMKLKYKKVTGKTSYNLEELWYIGIINIYIISDVLHLWYKQPITCWTYLSNNDNVGLYIFLILCSKWKK